MQVLDHISERVVHPTGRLHRSPRDIRLARQQADPDDILERVWEFGVIEPGSLGDCPGTLCCEHCGCDVTEGPAAWSFCRGSGHNQLFHGDCWDAAARMALLRWFS